ncbi:MAG: methylenetetrahydrofolate reductase [NAD(P)H] [Treponema sp.]|nr:methylenetetrahydrofolate reductase [NAD(P)H] [Treponema sp.]
MKIKEILEQKKVTVSFEVFPPKVDANMESVARTSEQLCALKPDFMSVTYGAGGTTKGKTVEIAQTILNTGTPALSHLTCVGNTKESINEAIKTFREKNIENILALRGDIPSGKTADTATGENLRHASDLVSILKKEGFCVGGACYPEGHPESANRTEDIDNLKYKVDAGVDFLTTQMFFDNNMLYAYLYKLQSKGIRVPVIAGIMPIVNSNQVERMVKLSSAYIPQRLMSITDRFQNNPQAMRQAGISYATEQIIDLISNGVRGIHIYAMNKADVVTDIFNNINHIIEATNA